MREFNPCAVIPVFNHEQALEQTVTELRAQQLPVILVDDGSAAECLEVERQLATLADVELCERPVNGGKGAAVKDGLRLARARGFSHALQIDADGQHASGDVPKFLTLGHEHPETLICGVPIYDNSVPKHRLYARYLTHVWVWINTLSLQISDSMCGFRLYPLAASVDLIEAEHCGDRMDFDSEILVRWHWRGKKIIELPTCVTYPRDGRSHFLPGLDNWLIAKMHTRLFFGMLRRFPRLLRNKFARR